MTIPEIKQRLPLATLLRHYGLQADSNHRLHCPFHKDRTPSMQVYPATHTAYCFSANCPTHGRSMDVIDFVMHHEKCSKHEAITKAATLIGSATGQSSALAAAPSPSTSSPSAALTDPNKAAFLEQMFTYFKNAVPNSKPAQAYIATRALDYKLLGIGYNTGQFHHGQRRDATLIKHCLEYGFLKDENLVARTGEKAYRVFGKACIVFALRDPANALTGLYFRSVVHNEQARHFYLKGSTGLYPGYPAPTTDRLLITESIIDAASLAQLPAVTAHYTVLAAYGTNRLNAEIKAAIHSLSGLKELIFAFDQDDAGRQATAKYARELQAALPQLTITTMELPNKDVNATLQAHEPTVFIHLLEQRKPVSITEATTVPAPAAAEVAAPTGPAYTLNTSNPQKLHYATDTADYYIQGGLPKALDTLKVTLFIQERLHRRKSRHKTELYDDRQTQKLLEEVSKALALDRQKLQEDLQDLTELLEQYREAEAEKPATGDGTRTPYVLTATERQAALDFLQQGNITHKLNTLLGQTGITGEQRNRLFLLLIAMSYKMNEPLHALVQGSSGSGKTKLVRQISDCMPPEDVTRFTRVSDKALYNYPRYYFKNRLLVIEDVDGLSEDAELAFRELQSNGELRSSVSIKLENGQITGGEKIVSGPIASMSCTTKGNVYEDNMSRVFLIAVDESAAQTQKILHYQNALAAGSIRKADEAAARRQIQHIIRMIEPKAVINPYAAHLRLPEEAHKIRRLNDLFQHFIKMVVLIHQYQRRQTADKQLIAQLDDLETAIDILFESIVLKVDELDGSLRQFFERVKSYLRQQYGEDYPKATFTQRELRQALHSSKAQVNRYLQALVTLEYLQAGGFINKGFTYKIAYWDNYQALRKRIKDNLQQQIDALKRDGKTARPDVDTSHAPPMRR